MPEGKPEPRRLAHVYQQRRNGPAITDEADDHRAVDDGLEFAFLQNVKQEAGEERARAQGDHGEIDEDPESEGEAVIHVGLVEPLDQAEACAIEAERQQRAPGKNPEQELARRRAADAAGHELTINLRHGRDPFDRSLVGRAILPAAASEAGRCCAAAWRTHGLAVW